MPAKLPSGLLSRREAAVIHLSPAGETIGRRDEQPVVGAVALGDELRHIGYIGARRRRIVGMGDDLSGCIGPSDAREGRALLQLSQGGIGPPGSDFPDRLSLRMASARRRHDRHPRRSAPYARRESLQNSAHRFLPPRSCPDSGLAHRRETERRPRAKAGRQAPSATNPAIGPAFDTFPASRIRATTTGPTVAPQR